MFQAPYITGEMEGGDLSKFTWNTRCNKGLKLACGASQAHVIQGQLPEGCTLVNTLLVPKFLLCLIVFVFAIKEGVSNFT